MASPVPSISTRFSSLQLIIGVCALLLSVEAANTPTGAGNETESKPNLANRLNYGLTSIHEIPCDTKDNCTANQICMNSFCRCRANYRWQKGGCVEDRCHNDAVCQAQDPNRYCVTYKFANVDVYSGCVCLDDYIEDHRMGICLPKCVNDMKGMCEQTPSGANSLCNVYRCNCKANYRRNSAGICEPFTCETDSQCWTEGDIYRTCLNGTCACTYELDPITQRCSINLTSLFKIRYYYSWRTERILLATIFIVPFVFYYCFRSSFRKGKSTVVAFRAPRPGETFYSHQSAITIQSPKFMTTSSGQLGVDEMTGVKKVDISQGGDCRSDPTGKSKDIKYERFH